MKIKTLYLILLITLLVSACSPSSAATNQSDELPAVQTEEISPTAEQSQDANLEQESVSFTLSSPDVAEAVLPTEYTCDGANATLPLTWSGAPAETESFAMVMHHTPGSEDTHWYWILYDIPADVTGLSKNSTGVGTLGTNSVNGNTEYAPPCSKGPGEKEYIYTVYALSATPQFSVPASQVSRDVLLAAIQDITLASSELNVTYSRSEAQDQDTNLEQEVVASADIGQGQPADGRTPPQEAIAACTDKIEQDTCEFTWDRGTETGVCEMVEEQLACSPLRGQPGKDQSSDDQVAGGSPGGGSDAAYNIEQALSDWAQGMTIAFDALAFLTGDLGSDSFFPPGKVADFWGFQYMRDNDPSQMGHNTDFLTKAAFNMLTILTPEQRAELVALAEGQVDSINEYGRMRFALMDAFHRLLEDDLPAGTTGLDEEAIKSYSAELYRLDGEISFER
ncbi:MAG: YbhB/YbcL family Raf kinase inhibitor-like protein, partial [Gammaproteobacteria bacterium]|nr:YbhB/YbcL family Raf kinase inhibitor-like protein [Gammaproteobacteria bacterium]